MQLPNSYLLKKGSLVSTHNARIAQKSDKVVKVCHSRDVAYDNVLKENEYFPSFFLVYFYQIDCYY